MKDLSKESVLDRLRIFKKLGERNLFCKNIDSAAKRILQIIKRGY